MDLASGQAVAADWSDWCASHPGERVMLWLGGAWLVECPSTDEPIAPATLLANARRGLAEAHGDAPADWSVARWRSGPHQGVSALPAARLQMLLTSAARHGVRVVGIQPAWSRALARLRLPSGTAACKVLVEGRRLTVLRLRDGALRAVDVDWLPAEDETSRKAWQLQQPAPAPSWISAQSGAGADEPGRRVPCDPPQWLAPDQGAPSHWAWILSGTCALGAAMSVWSALERWQTLDQMTNSAPVAAASSASAPAPKAPDPALQTRQNAVARPLNHPWQTVFLGSEQGARAGWQWLSLDHDAVTGELHAEAVHVDESAVFRLPGLLQQAGWQAPLVRSLQVNAVNGTSQRVSVDARLGAAASPPDAAASSGGASR